MACVMPVAAAMAAGQFDQAVAAKWKHVSVMHVDVVGVITATHAHIPPGDYDHFSWTITLTAK